MKFKHCPDLSAKFGKPTYTYDVRGIVYMLMPQYRKQERKEYRKTGKAWWYVKVGRVDIKPCIRSARMLTLEQALLWAEVELFPTRISLLFDDE